MARALSGLLDRALDLSVGPGYTRLGLVLRRSWWPDDPAPDALSGRAVAITGANSGLGEATAVGVARLGARTFLLCRSTDKGEHARARILDQVPGATVTVVEADVSDLDAVPGIAERLLAQLGGGGLHALVHNAGVMPPERTESAQGHELTYATHVLGPHLLTHLLRGALAADGDARVVFLSSGGMYTASLRVDDPEFARGEYDGTDAYARTKRMQVHLAERWAEELRTEGIAVHSAHPGWADTPGVQDSLPGFYKVTKPFLRSAEEGADTSVWLTAAPEAVTTTGEFWHDRRPRPTAYLGRNAPSPADVERLWQQVVEATSAP